jgi:hypothetical protein
MLLKGKLQEHCDLSPERPEIMKTQMEAIVSRGMRDESRSGELNARKPPPWFQMYNKE